MSETGDPSRILGNLIYTSRPHAYTHPQNLYLMGSLFGLNPPDFRKCSVLELGCAGGGNILPLALDYPDARFTGYDIAANHIDEASRHKQALDLRNLTFETKDVADIGPGDGKFDYIIVHGLLSWVPEPVREHIFRVCSENLTPHGLAYISYNAMPGWEILRQIRDQLVSHVGGIGDPQERFLRARKFLAKLAASAAKDNRYKIAVDSVRQAFAGEDPSYALYEYTGAINNPFSFSEIAAMAHAHGLQYVSETLILDMQPDNPSPETTALLSQAKDFNAWMKSLDIILNRKFHRSIFTHADLPVRRNISRDFLFKHYLIPAFAPDSPPAFRGTRWKDLRFSADNPLMTSIFSALAENSERAVRLDDVLAAVAGNMQKPVDEDLLRSTAAEKIFGLLAKGLIFLSAEPDRHAVRLSKRPKAYALARYQAALPGCGWVTNCRHETIQMPDRLALFILQHLDGTNTKDDLLALALDRFSKEVDMPGDPYPVLDKEIPVIMRKILERILLVS